MILEKTNQLDQQLNYKMVDIAKYIAAFFVIVIHSKNIIPNDYLNFMFQNVLCRIAVPYFFISSAYFVRKNSKEKNGYFQKYIKKSISSYLLWSLFFIPVGMSWLDQVLKLPFKFFPLGLIVGLFDIGTYYHLWYIAALLFSLIIIHQLLKKHSYKKLFSLSMILFLIGCAETYYGILPTLVKEMVDGVISVLFTFRNGLFFGLIFTLIGFFIYDHQEKLLHYRKYFAPLSLCFAVGLFLEGNFLYTIERLDMNFLIFLVPFSFCFFLWTLTCSFQIKKSTTHLRALSKYYYFIHPLAINMVGLATGLQLHEPTVGFVSFLFVIALTHIVSYCTIEIYQYLSQLEKIRHVSTNISSTFVLIYLLLFVVQEVMRGYDCYF